MQVKTSELIGPALNWAVGTCEGHDKWRLSGKEFGPHHTFTDLNLNYSSDWAQGGPIIEREGVAVRKYGDLAETVWQADKWAFRFADPQAYGPTPLIAAMRCYVASKLGDEVDVPDELGS